MARFSYTAQKTDGEVYNGTVEAKDRFEVYEIVRGEGAHIISLSEEHSNSLWSPSYWNAKFATVSEYEKVLFARNLGAMLSAGLSLARALAVLERQIKNPRMAKVLSQVAGSVRRGDSLNASLSNFPHVFSKLFVSMVRAGEEGGDLPGSLTIVSEQMERMYVLKKKVRGAMIYPAIVILAMLGIGFLMMTNVVPTLAQTFSEMNVELPASTRLIVGISNFLVANTTLAVLLIIGVIAACYFGLRTRPGKRGSDYLLLRLPIISDMVREVNAARTSRTLASLLASGVDVLTSLEIVADVLQNTYFRDTVRSAAKAVGQGEALSVTFIRNDKLYPSFVGEMMAVGEETGQTNEMLKRLAIFYEAEVDRKTKDMTTIIEPFLMILIGAGVGFFALAMITPIYEISQNM